MCEVVDIKEDTDHTIITRDTRVEGSRAPARVVQAGAASTAARRAHGSFARSPRAERTAEPRVAARLLPGALREARSPRGGRRARRPSPPAAGGLPEVAAGASLRARRSLAPPGGPRPSCYIAGTAPVIPRKILRTICQSCQLWRGLDSHNAPRTRKSMKRSDLRALQNAPRSCSLHGAGFELIGASLPMLYNGAPAITGTVPAMYQGTRTQGARKC